MCVGEEVSKSMLIMTGEEGLEFEVYLGGIHLEQVSGFKYVGCVLDVSGIDWAECSSKVTSGRKFAGAIRFLVNARVCSCFVLDSCMKHFLYLFLCMVVRQYYGTRRRDLELR